MHLAKVTGATLVIAKLDRLSRNAAFLLTLRDSGVPFLAVDLPEANDLTVGIMALVAQQEREAISKRTKEALAVARSRGVRLGNPNGAAALKRAGKGRCAAQSGHRPQRRPACPGPGARGRGHPHWWSDQPAGYCGGTEQPRHAYPARRALARLYCDKPPRSARIRKRPLAAFATTAGQRSEIARRRIGTTKPGTGLLLTGTCKRDVSRLQGGADGKSKQPSMEVLIVDDDIFLRLDLSDRLSRRGFSVFRASDADQAIGIMEKHPSIAAVFSDLQMPGSMDGLARFSMKFPVGGPAGALF